MRRELWWLLLGAAFTFGCGGGGGEEGGDGGSDADTDADTDTDTDADTDTDTDADTDADTDTDTDADTDADTDTDTDADTDADTDGDADAGADAGADDAGSGGECALSILERFESGDTDGWFTYADTDNGAGVSLVIGTTSLISEVGVVSDSVMEAEITSAGWGAGFGLELVPAQDWSCADGLRLWFAGTGSGASYKVILSDDSGTGDDAERFAAVLVDDSAGWRELLFPWPVFLRDTSFQPAGAPDDGLTLTEVHAVLFQPMGMGTGAFALDQIALFGDTFAVVDDFESGDLGDWFTYADTGASVETIAGETAEISALGDASNAVLDVSYTATGWGVGFGRSVDPAEDWSAADGLAFWFDGTGSGAAYRVILWDNGSGAGDTAERFTASFADDVAGWRELAFPWPVFLRDTSFQPAGAPDDGLTLTAVSGFTLTTGTAGTGSCALDRVRLFETTRAIVDDFESGVGDGWFTYADEANGAGVELSAAAAGALSRVGAQENDVLVATYTAAGWGVGWGRELDPYEDWSAADGLALWFEGKGSGATFKLIVHDDGDERLAARFTDDSTGWRELRFPWPVFTRDADFQPAGAPDDGPTLTGVRAYAFQPVGSGTGTCTIDRVRLF